MVYNPFATRVDGVDSNHAADVNVINVGLGTFTRGVYSIFENGGIGDGTSDDGGHLATTDSVNGGNGISLVPRNSAGYAIAANQTILNPLRLEGKLLPASGKVVTINGAFSAPLVQVFGGAGTVAFGSQVREFYAEWFGAKGDGTTDDLAAIQAAIAAIQTTPIGGVLVLLGRNYRISGSVHITKPGVWVVGQGMYTTRLLLDAAATGPALLFDTIPPGPPFGARDLGILQTSASRSQNGVQCISSVSGYFDRVWVNGCQYGFNINGGGDYTLTDCLVEGCPRGYNAGNTSALRFNTCNSYQNTVGWWMQDSTALTGTDEEYSTSLVGCRSYEDINIGWYGQNWANTVLTDFEVNDSVNPVTDRGIDGTGLTNISINGPLIAHTVSHGIYLRNSTGVRIALPTIKDVGNYSPLPAVFMAGIELDNCPDHSVVGGEIRGCQGSGMYTTSRGKVVGTDFIDNALANAGTQGLYALETAMGSDPLAYYQIVACRFNSTAGRNIAIQKTSGQRWTIEGNVFDGFTTNVNALNGTIEAADNTRGILVAANAWTPTAALANGATTTTTVGVKGAAVGDPVTVSFTTLTAAAWQLSAFVSATDMVLVVLTNQTGGTVTLAAGTVRVEVWKH